MMDCMDFAKKREKKARKKKIPLILQFFSTVLKDWGS